MTYHKKPNKKRDFLDTVEGQKQYDAEIERIIENRIRFSQYMKSKAHSKDKKYNMDED